MKKLLILALAAAFAVVGRGQPTPAQPRAATQAQVNAGLDNTTFVTPLTLAGWTGGGSGGGVSSVAIATANGFSGSSSGGTTPILTIVAGAITPTSVNGLTISATTGTFSLTSGKTLTVSNSLTFAGTDSTTMTFPPASANIGYLGIPQNSQSAAYTTVLGDRGKHILHPTADNNARTFTIDSNANVAYAIGDTLTFINQINTVTIAITSDTLTFYNGSGTASTGSRTLAAGGIATCVKVGTTSWTISGPGVSMLEMSFWFADAA